MGGSASNTSIPAPARRPLFKASARAALSTTGPREVLMRMADGFIFASSSFPMSPLVSEFKGVWRETISQEERSVSIST